MRIGLVLGAGGVVGGSWLIGALEALESETGWSPTSAEVISGTSAGSVIGAMTAAGIEPALLAAYASGGAGDEVVCLNPMSSLTQVTPRSAAERVAARFREQSGRRLGREARKLRDRGTDVLILQPTAEDLAVMGTNFMARDRREAVVARAIRTTARQLRRRRDRPGVVFPSKTPAHRREARPAAERKAA
jgi:hypothetical protein